jgi:hypothetical protein
VADFRSTLDRDQRGRGFGWAARRTAAAELPAITWTTPYASACRADAEPYERAAVCWLGRFALEHRAATVAMLQPVVAAFKRLPGDPEAGASWWR